MIPFIDAYRDAHGVEPICRELQVAPSSYYAATRRSPSARSVSDATMADIVARVHRANFGVYGIRKVWKALARLGIEAGRDQVARIMRQASYGGWYTSIGSGSATIDQRVLAHTVTTIVSDLNPALESAAVTLTAAVSADNGPPAGGTLTLTDTTTGTVIGSLDVGSRGTRLVVRQTFSIGDHHLVATYARSP